MSGYENKFISDGASDLICIGNTKSQVPIHFMVIIVEAVRLLEENRRLSRDLSERTELLKMKYLVDKEMRHRVENELMKTII